VSEGSLTDHEKEGVKFLDRDFAQCFQQMRHYDGQIVDICKFSFTGYIAVVGTGLALYKHGNERNIDYTLPSVAILCLAAIFGFILLGLVVRNRVYFVIVARYVNEHRGFFLKDKPLGFANESKMFTNFAYPPYFSWLSSQSWLIYVIIALNAAMIAVATFLICIENKSDYWLCLRWGVFMFLSLAGVQLFTSVRYLKKRDQKSASVALWGNNQNSSNVDNPPTNGSGTALEHNESNRKSLHRGES